MYPEGKFRNGFARITRIACALTLVWAVLGACFLAPVHAMGQQTNSTSQLPDAPRPQNNAPQNPPPTTPTPVVPEQAAPPQGPVSPNAPLPRSADEQGDEQAAPVPPPRANIQTAPIGTVVAPDPGSREELTVIRKNVNFVTVPVTVKDRDGHLVPGLLANDFSIYEEGVKQKLRFFTSDPFPLSAAVVIDLGMSDTELSKVRQTLPALVGAFGQFDEVSIYSYGNTVKKWQELTPADKISTSMLRQLKSQRGANSGAPVVGGPLGQSGPVINGRKMDNTPNIETMPSGPIEQSRVLNDAILAAAQDLARRDRARRAEAAAGTEYRKILFIISDGRELGSVASYADVMKVLLSNDIMVYAVGVGGAAIPIYGKLQKLNIPRTGTGNILPKYASATGGQVFTEFTQDAIESAYSRVTEEARNQYTLGYTTRATPSSAYRTIEVRVNKPGLRIYARDGYYPLPPERPGQKKP